MMKSYIILIIKFTDLQLTSYEHKRIALHRTLDYYMQEIIIIYEQLHFTGVHAQT